MWRTMTISIMGLWVAVSPFIPIDLESVKINNLLFGLLITLTAWDIKKTKIFYRWVSIILGIWLFFSGCIPILVIEPLYFWNNFISGILIFTSGLMLSINFKNIISIN